MEVRVTLNCPINPEEIGRLMPFLTDNLPNVRSFDGCLSVDVYFDPSKQEMLLEEKWQSQEHHQAYMAFISDNGVLAELGAFFSASPEVKYFVLENI